MAPYLRKFGCYTVPDFIGTRYGGRLTRFCAIIVLIVASFTYVTAQITATGTIAARAFLIPFEIGVWLGLAGILVCSMLGGMRAVTWTQVAQYIVLIIAYLVPISGCRSSRGSAACRTQYGSARPAHHGTGAAPRRRHRGRRRGRRPEGDDRAAAHATRGAMAAWKFVTLAFCMMSARLRCRTS